MAGRDWSTADGASFSSTTEPSGPLSDWPVNVTTRSIRSDPSRPLRIGWSPSSPFRREKLNCAGKPASALVGSSVMLLPISTPSLAASVSAGSPAGMVVGDQQQRSARLDPVWTASHSAGSNAGFAACGLPITGRSLSVRHHQDLAALERFGVNFSVFGSTV